MGWYTWVLCCTLVATMGLIWSSRSSTVAIVGMCEWIGDVLGFVEVRR